MEHDISKENVVSIFRLKEENQAKTLLRLLLLLLLSLHFNLSNGSEMFLRIVSTLPIKTPFNNK
jgi:hypothetical protein